MINLRSEKDVHIPVGAPRRRMEPISTQKEAQVEEEHQQLTFQPIDVNKQSITSVENNNPIIIEECAAVLATSIQNIAKERQPAQPAAAQQFRHPSPFP